MTRLCSRPIHRGGIILLAGAGLLAWAWVVTSAPALPLYDGLGLPPQPYRYLVTPKGAHSSGLPTTARASLALSHGNSPFEPVVTNEQPPQAQLILDQNAIRTPTGSAQITITIKAVPPPAPLPGTLDGNVYRIDATSGNAVAVTFRKGKANIALRGTGERGVPVIEQYRNGAWVQHSTGQYLGIAIYTTTITDPGDYALVFAGKGVPTSTGESFLPYIIIAVLIVGLAVVGILLVRLARTGAPNTP